MNAQANFTLQTTCDPYIGVKTSYLRIADVKRDMDLIRDILLTIQDKSDLSTREIRIEGYDPALVSRHIEMLHRAGFLEGISNQQIGYDIPTVLVSDLTWEGHDFAGALADRTIFEAVKRSLTPAQLVSVPLAAIKEVATKLVIATLSSKLGI